MPTPLRYVPQDVKIWKDGKGRPIAVVEMTIRTLLGLFLLKLTTRNASLILGVLGRAKEQHDFSWTDSGIAAVVDAGRIGLSVSGVWNIPGQFDNFNALNFDEGFKITSISASPAGTVTIEWSDIGLNYTVQETTSLLFPAWSPAAGSWSMATNAWSGAASTSNNATFYRVIGQE